MAARAILGSAIAIAARASRFRVAPLARAIARWAISDANGCPAVRRIRPTCRRAYFARTHWRGSLPNIRPAPMSLRRRRRRRRPSRLRRCVATADAAARLPAAARAAARRCRRDASYAAAPRRRRRRRAANYAADAADSSGVYAAFAAAARAAAVWAEVDADTEQSFGTARCGSRWPFVVPRPTSVGAERMGRPKAALPEARLGSLDLPGTRSAFAADRAARSTSSSSPVSRRKSGTRAQRRRTPGSRRICRRRPEAARPAELPAPLPNVDAPFAYGWTASQRVAVVAGAQNLPFYPHFSSEEDHRRALEACRRRWRAVAEGSARRPLQRAAGIWRGARILSRRPAEDGGRGQHSARQRSGPHPARDVSCRRRHAA